MAERKLNLNAPLLSVRRMASRPMSPHRENARIGQSSPPPPSVPDFCLEQVTEPVAVPFNWEQIPGRAKYGKGTEPSSKEKASFPSRICPVQGRDCGHKKKTDVKPQIMTSFGSNVIESKDSKDGSLERWGLVVEDEDDDVYSDALDTLSSKESVSLNCSASGLSGSDGAGLVRPSGSFATDPQTRDYMMKRFLPAAKAMAMEPPRNYATKKQTAAVQEQPREVKRIVGGDNRPNLVVPRYGDYKEEVAEEESEEEEVDKYNEPQIISNTGCGLFPRLCFRNSLSLLGPIPGLKVSSPKPTKSAQTQSLTKSVMKAWDNYKKKSDSRPCSDESKVSENKRADESRRFRFSGELKGRLSPFRNSRTADTDSTPKQKKTDIRSRSGELRVVENKAWAGESRRFTYSGELYRGRLSPFRNTRAPDVDNMNKISDAGHRSVGLKIVSKKPGGDSGRMAHSGDQHPFRNSRPTSISPYRNQSNQSPFRRAAFLGVPKVVKVEASIAITRPKVEETSTNQGSFSIVPVVEKTLYVDTVNSAKTSHPRSDYLGNNTSEPLGVEESSAEFSFEDIKCQNKELGHDILLPVDDKLPSLLRVEVEQQVKTLGCSETLTIKKDIDQKEELLDVNSSSAQSPAPPPLPRSPSESWLWRTIPSISLRNSFGSKGQAKNLDSKTSSSSTKWETIVKSSKLHHDHGRYSEELVAHISKQSKT